METPLSSSCAKNFLLFNVLFIVSLIYFVFMDRIPRCLFLDGHDHLDYISVVIFYMDQGVRGTLFEATSHTHPE
jgi:hypothetical protein